MEIKNKYNMTTDENIFVAKRNVVDYIWKSANLEGIAVTYSQTEVLYEGLSVGGLKIKDIDTIVNLKHAWQFTIENIDYSLDFRYISQLNKIIGEREVVPFAGKLRTTDVKMGGTDWKPDIPQKEEVEKNINMITKIENATDRALTLMLYLMRTQAFYDGNKRTAMMAANQIMIQNGVGIISISLKEQEQFRNLLIKYYESNKMDQIKSFIYEKCIDGIHFNKEKNINNNSWNEKLKKDQEKELALEK